jgi:type II secretory ATPase GspE/PulE/Tfp pilus assembly ATPase PilB-like protein
LNDAALQKHLVSSGLLDPDTLEQVLQFARSRRRNVAESVLELGLLAEPELYKAVAKAHGMSFVDPGGRKIAASLTERIPAELALENRALPVVQKDADAPIIKLVDKTITEALEQRERADIHVEPFETDVRVRFRIDGVLTRRVADAQEPPGPLTLASQDDGGHGHRREAQAAGRPHPDSASGGRDIDIRTSVLPGNHGETIVMRLLDKERWASSASTALGFTRRGQRPLPARHQATERHLPGDRADGLGQDHDALRRADELNRPT